MHAQGFHDGFAAQLGFQAEKIFERAIGEVNPAVAVEQKQTLQHAVEQDLLLGLGVSRCLLLPSLKLLHLGLRLPPLVEKFMPPPEMNSHGGGKGKNGQEWPHEAKAEGRMKNAETNCERMKFDKIISSFFILPSADRKSTRLNSSHANISYAVF